MISARVTPALKREVRNRLGESFVESTKPGDVWQGGRWQSLLSASHSPSTGLMKHQKGQALSPGE